MRLWTIVQSRRLRLCDSTGRARRRPVLAWRGSGRGCQGATTDPGGRLL